MPFSRKPFAPKPGSLLAWQILAPITALFFILVVLSGFIARNRFEPVALQRDLARAERYAQFAAVVFAERLPQTDPRRLSEEFWAAGLDTLNFLPPESMPVWASPRFVISGPFVDAWAPVRTTDGNLLGAISLRRQADAFVLVRQTILSFAIASCAVFALLVGLAWLLFKRRVTDRLKGVARKIAPAAPRAAPKADAIDDVRSAVETAQSQTRSREEPMRRYLAGHTEMACLSSPEGVILDANDAYCRFFDRRRENLVGTNYLDLIPPSERADALASVQKLSRSNPVNFSEHSVLLPDGSTRWVRWRDTAVFGDSGAIKEILSYGTDISTEKNLAGEIAGLKVAFAQMQSLAETGSFTWDFALDRMEWTNETRRLLGVGVSEPPSIDAFLAVVLPDDRERVRRLFHEAREQGRNFQHEFRAILADGSLRVLQSRAEVLADPKTKLLNNLTCTLRDVTSLRDAESATKRELRFREAVEESLAAGIVVRDMNGKTLSANPAFCAMTGFAEHELKAAAPPEEPYWPKDEQPRILEALKEALAGKSPTGGFELVFRRKDGSLFDVLVNVTPMLDKEGTPYALLGAVIDISVIQRIRRELENANERMRIAQDVVGLGIWDWDPVADTLYWDENSLAFFGHPGASDPKKVWESALSEEERLRLTYELKRLIAAGGANGQDRLCVRWPDGTEHDILSTYVILRDASGIANRVIGVNRDVTAELEQERDLRLAQERLNAALEGGKFGTFEHIIGVGDVNWSPANYEINGIDPSITEPPELFAAWKATTGEFFAELMAQMEALPVTENHYSYEFTSRPAGKEPRRVRVNIFIERNKHGHPVRLVGITRRAD
jgi:PAS domain S-box-containing protein